tara:strand:- start:664 stop:2991 length:2328 start_codon:yes stop_codon:yes gene_type:complete
MSQPNYVTIGTSGELLTTINYTNIGSPSHIIVVDGVTDIADNCFDNQPNLLSIVIPDSVTSIGSNSFNQCESLDKIMIYKGGIKYTKIYDESDDSADRTLDIQNFLTLDSVGNEWVELLEISRFEVYGEISYDLNEGNLEIEFTDNLVNLVLENVTIDKGGVLSDLVKDGSVWRMKVTIPISVLDNLVEYTINVTYQGKEVSIKKNYNTYAPIIGGISAIEIINNIPDEYTEDEKSILIPNLTNAVQLTTGTASEMRSKRKEFVSQIMKRNKDKLKDSNKKIVMSTVELLGENNTIKKNKIRILDSYNVEGTVESEISFDIKTLGIDEGVYVPLEKVGDSVVLATTNNKLRIQKASETTYDIYEGYVDETSVLTKTMNEEETSEYDKFKYLLGSVGGELQTLESISVEDIIYPKTEGELTIIFNQSISELDLQGYVSLNPSYIGTIGEIISLDGGITYKGKITRTLYRNRLSNKVNLDYNGILGEAEFDAYGDVTIGAESGEIERKIVSMDMSDKTIKFPETGSDFEVILSTNDKTILELQGNLTLEPITSGTLTNIELARDGYSLVGRYNAASQEESVGNKLKYSENGLINEDVEFILSTSEKAISNICFNGEAKVLTGTGYKLIREVKTGMKVQGEEIEEVTMTTSKDEEIVLIKKGSIMRKMPLEDTRITKEHKVLYKGEMKEAKELVNGETIVYEEYKGETLYNILLKGEGKMVVNGMIVETLSPSNNIAKLYKILKGYKEEEKEDIIRIYNEERGSLKKKSNNKNKIKKK